MSDIFLYEKELRLNKVNIQRVEKMNLDDAVIAKDYRSLLVQRSNLKDMLLNAYRAEVLERENDYEAALANGS